MAELRTDFKDDILAEAMGGRRRYQMIQNEDGTVSFPRYPEDIPRNLQAPGYPSAD